MHRFDVNEFMDYLYPYPGDDVMDCGLWENELMDDEFYSRCEFSRRNKIVELTDTSCDARSPGQSIKNNRNSYLKKIKKLDDLKSNEKARKVGPKNGISKNHGNKYSPFKDEMKKNSKPSKKNSLLNFAVSNSTFVVSDRETRKPTTDFELFDNFGDINQRYCKILHDEDSNDYQGDGIQNRRKFVDRAVDSDCLSNSSEHTVEKDTSCSELHTELMDGNKKEFDDANISKNEKSTKRIARTKLLTKSSSNAKEDIVSANKYRLKSNSFTPKKISSPTKNLKNRQGSESDTLQGRQKLSAASRTIIKKKDPKITKQAPETLKSSKSFLKDDENENHVAKKGYFRGSKLPVWQGWHKKSKAPLNVDTAKKQKEIQIKKFEDEIDITSISSENAEVGQIKNFKVTNVKKTEELIEENTEEFTLKKARGRLTSSKIQVPVAVSGDDLVKFKSVTFLEPSKKTENIIFKNCSHDEEIMKYDEDKNVKYVEEGEISAESKRSGQIISKDASLSELWTENFEKAYARGIAIGLKVHRMAKTMREKRSEFA